jgi:hypothetical protein
LTAEHLPGNLIADEESKRVRDRCDWMPHPDLFARIQRVLGPLEVDLFASRLTHQLPRYISWKPDLGAEATDAFTQDWSCFRGYANPSWCLLLATLAKIRHQKAQVVLVAPVWKTQPWYPLVLELLTGFPLLLPQEQWTVISPVQKVFIMPEGVPQLAIWPLSGRSAEQQAFQRQLLNCSEPYREARLNPTSSLSSKSEIAGVRIGVEIPFKAL